MGKEIEPRVILTEHYMYTLGYEPFYPHSFQYCGETYIVKTKEMFNELYRLAFNNDWNTLELLIECSDEIQKI